MATMKTTRKVATSAELSALGAAIRDMRLAADIPQEKLAELAKIDQGGISNIERGKREVTAPNLVAIARALNSTPSRVWSVAETKIANDQPEATAAKRVTGATGGKRESIAIAHALGTLVQAITGKKQASGADIVRLLDKAPPEAVEPGGLIEALREVALARSKAPRKSRGTRSD